ncbi:hypothetical protein Tco_0780292 [Tanacetum coccineum]
MTELTQKDRKFDWGKEQETAFQLLKHESSNVEGYWYALELKVTKKNNNTMILELGNGSVRPEDLDDTIWKAIVVVADALCRKERVKTYEVELRGWIVGPPIYQNGMGEVKQWIFITMYQNRLERQPIQTHRKDWAVALTFGIASRTEKLDWVNPEGGDYPFDLTKPLPLVTNGNCQMVSVDYFFNNDLKYLQGGISTMTYTTSIMKTKAAQYDLPGIDDMAPNIWSPVKVAYDKYALWGISYWRQQRKTFYGYARGLESSHDVYSTKRM